MAFLSLFRRRSLSHTLPLSLSSPLQSLASSHSCLQYMIRSHDVAPSRSFHLLRKHKTSLFSLGGAAVHSPISSSSSFSSSFSPSLCYISSSISTNALSRSRSRSPLLPYPSCGMRQCVCSAKRGYASLVPSFVSLDSLFLSIFFFCFSSFFLPSLITL